MDSYERKRKQNSGFVVTIALDGSAVAATHAQSVRSTNHTIYVQKVIVTFLTHVDGKVFTVQDDGTPTKIIDILDDAENDTTAMADQRTFDFGSDGIALAAGKNLDYVANTAGTGFLARVQFIGYQKLSSVINTGTANTAN